MFIYKISNRTPLTPRSQIYVLHFAVKMIDNEMTRVNRTYEGHIDTMVVDMMRSDLDSKKNLIVEETKGLHKFVMPRIKPLKNAIATLSGMAEPLKYNSSGMLFYEDSTGFRFRSLENMLAINGVARPVTAKFQMKPRNVKQGTSESDVIKEMQTVDGYTIKDQFDTLKNLSNGYMLVRR